MGARRKNANTFLQPLDLTEQTVRTRLKLVDPANGGSGVTEHGLLDGGVVDIDREIDSIRLEARHQQFRIDCENATVTGVQNSTGCELDPLRSALGLGRRGGRISGKGIQHGDTRHRVGGIRGRFRSKAGKEWFGALCHHDGQSSHQFQALGLTPVSTAKSVRLGECPHLILLGGEDQEQRQN